MPLRSAHPTARSTLAGAVAITLLLGALWACADRADPTSPPPTAGSPGLDLSDVPGGAGPVALTLVYGPEKCMALRDESGAEGTPVIVAPCAGAGSERFTWTSGGELRVTVAGVSKCVTADGAGNDRDPLVVRGCVGASSQLWAANAHGELRGNGGLCVDATNNAADGAPLVLYGCYGTAVSWQRWAARGVGRSVVFASVIDPGKCLEVGGDPSADGSPVVTNACSGAASQRFTWLTNGELRASSGKCVTADGAGNTQDPIVVRACAQTLSQRWVATTNDELRGNGGLCLDVTGEAVNGARAVLYTCYGTAFSWQRWSDRVNPSGSAPCGVGFTAVVTDEDALLAAYGIPATTDTVRVCETWTGSDYVVRETRGGSAPNAFRDPDTARTVVYSGGMLTGVAADGGPAHEAVAAGPTAFDFMQVDAAGRQAAVDDPYHVVYAGEDPPCGGPIRCSVGVSAEAVVLSRTGGSRSVADTGGPRFARHGLRRRGVRALVDDAEEVGRSAAGHRRFRKQRGNAEVVLTLDKDTELLVAEETTGPKGTTKATHTWQKNARGDYVRGRTEVEAVETVGGRPLRSRTTITLYDVERNGVSASPAVPSTLRRTP